MNIKIYTQGVISDGAAILCNGEMMTIDEIIVALNKKESALEILDTLGTDTRLGSVSDIIANALEV